MKSLPDLPGGPPVRHLLGALAAASLTAAAPLAAPLGNPLAGAPTSVSPVATGFGLTEGPLWSDALGGLLFSEFGSPNNVCTGGNTRLFVPGGALTTLRSPSCNANGLAFDPRGLLLSCEHGSRSVTRRLPDGTLETLAASYTGTPLNAPNDLAVRSDGTIWFTDPDLVGPPPPVLGFSGLYRIDPLGALSLEAVMHSPNGIALSPDEGTLYVTNQNLAQVVSFTVRSDGSLADQLPFAAGAPKADGLTVDRDGNLYVACEAPGGGALYVFAPDGALWGQISVPAPAHNCAFGGRDRRTLFVTAGGGIYSARMVVPGANDPPRPTRFRRLGRDGAGGALRR